MASASAEPNPSLSIHISPEECKITDERNLLCVVYSACLHMLHVVIYFVCLFVYCILRFSLFMDGSMNFVWLSVFFSDGVFYVTDCFFWSCNNACCHFISCFLMQRRTPQPTGIKSMLFFSPLTFCGCYKHKWNTLLTSSHHLLVTNFLLQVRNHFRFLVLEKKVILFLALRN